MAGPKVSVVMPFLNGDNFIREAVASVRAQSLAGWELVMVDDGSTDASAAWARAEAAADPRIRLLTHPGGVNRGLERSRVLGLDAARGAYALFLDHDDVLEPRALERMAGMLDRAGDEVAAVFAATLFWAFDPVLEEEDWPQDMSRLGEGRIAGARMLRDLIRSDDRHPAPCSVLFRTEALVAARDSAPAYPGMYEDTALLFKLLARGDVWICPEVVSSYRMHSASMCHKAEAAGTYAKHGPSRDRARFLRWALRHVPMDWKSRALIVRVLAGYARARLRV